MGDAFYSGGLEGNMSLRGKQRRGGNVLERDGSRWPNLKNKLSDRMRQAAARAG
jgi:hypothetical protein